MKNAIRGAAVGLALLSAVWGSGTLVLPAVAATTVTTTAGVNVRSGPGLDQPIIGGLPQGTQVQATGPATNGWTPVLFNGRAAWISSDWLTGDGGTGTTSAGGSRATTAWLNVRAGAGTTYAVLRTLAPQTSVDLTGREQNGFAELVGGGWVSTSFLTASVTTTPVASTGAVRTMTTTSALNFRSGPSLDDAVLRVLAEGTQVQATGRSSNGFLEVTVAGATGWCSEQYLTDGASSTTTTAPTPVVNPTPAPSTPVATGTRWSTTALNIRSTPSFDNDPVGFVPQGTALQVTGVVEGEWTQVVYSGATRWAYTSLLTSVAPGTSSNLGPSVGLAGLLPTTAGAVWAIQSAFPQITTVYGVRPDGVGQDHTEGRAADFMIPSYGSNHALGQAVADYLQAHAAQYDVRYIIWEQRIWLADAPWQGWTWMADRGSDTQNHYDHVHLSVH